MKPLKTRSNFEKTLIVIIVILLCFSLALFIAFLLQNSKSTAESESLNSLHVCDSSGPAVCLTEQCINSAATIMESIDQTVDPCSNFYKFACGGFIKKAAETETITPLSKLSTIMKTQLNNIITDPDLKPMPKSVELMRTFYQSCMNTTALEEDNTNTLMNLIQKIGGWPILYGRYWDGRKFSWVDETVLSRKVGLKHDYFLSVTAMEKTNSFLVTITPPITRRIGNRFKDAYIDLMTYVAIELGASETALTKDEFSKVLMLEEEIQKYIIDEEQNRTDYVWNVSKLYQEFPNIAWIPLLTNLTNTTTNTSTLIRFRGQTYLKKLENLLSRTPKQTQGNYIVWKIIEDFQHYLKGKLRDHFDTFAKNLNPLIQSRHDFCLGEAKTYFPSVYQLAYVRKYMRPEKRKNIEIIVHMIKKQMIEDITASKWIDEATKIYAKVRLKEMDVHVGSSKFAISEDFDKVVELNNFVIATDNVVEMRTKLTIKKFDEHFKLLNRPTVEITRLLLETSPIMEINAFYFDMFNTLILPAPFLQDIMYNTARPQYLNFGSLGSVIGHEMSHQFYGTSKLFPEETKKFFSEKSQCAIDGFTNYTDHQGQFATNATQALQEILADLVGPTLAYKAYQQWAVDNNQELPLPGLNYTPNQIFWIMSSMSKCQRLDKLKRYIYDQEHATPSFTVNFSLKNSANFNSAFNCSTNSNMNSGQKCEIF